MDKNISPRNRILFEGAKKIEIPSNGNETHLQEALSVNKEISRYGYTLDTRGIMALAVNSVADIKEFKENICSLLDMEVGLSDFAGSEPFYPNFPEEVMEKNEFELAVNTMYYYAFSQTDDPVMSQIASDIRKAVTDDERILREPLSSEETATDLKMLCRAEYGELEAMLSSRIGGLSISDSRLKDIKEYAAAYPAWADGIVPVDADGITNIPSHETRAEIAGIAYEQKNLDATSRLLPKAEDVLRFASVLSGRRHKNRCGWSHGMDANLSFMPQNAEFSLSRSDKTAIKRMLDKKPDLFTSMWHREDMWKKLMNRLDTRDARFPRVEQAFDNLRNGIRQDEYGHNIQPTPGQAIEKLMTEVKTDPDHSGPAIEAFADKYPKVFIRNIERISRELKPRTESLKALCRSIEKNAADVPAVQLLKLEKHIEKADGWDMRIFTNAKGNVYSKENTMPDIDIRIKSSIMDALDKAIERNMITDREKVTVTDKETGETRAKKVFIDDGLENIKAPLRNMRNASDGAVLTKYSVVKTKKDHNIIAFGIFWKNQGDERADIDLAVTGYKDGYESPREIYYGHLKEDWGVHSGDYTSGKISPEINGAVEFVFIDKNICREHGIRYIIPSVHGFNRPFDEASSVRFCIMEKQGSLDDVTPADRHIYSVDKGLPAPTFQGAVFEPSQIKASYRLTQHSTTATPLVYDLKEERFIWADISYVISDWIQNVCNKTAISRTEAVLYEVKHNDYPSMRELFTRYADANGLGKTTDIKEADIIFTVGNIDEEELGIKPDADVITSFEIDRIAEEFCGATEDIKEE